MEGRVADRRPRHCSSPFPTVDPDMHQPPTAAPSSPLAPYLRKAFLFLSSSPRLGRAVTDSRLAWRGARRFVAGQTVEQAIAVVRELNNQGLTASLDHLGENISRLEDARQTADAYLLAIDQICASGVRSGVSLKLTALGMDLGPEVAEEQLRRILAKPLQPDFGTQDRFDTALAPLFVELDGTKQVAQIGDGQGWLAISGCRFDNLVDAVGAVNDGIFGVQTQMYKHMGYIVGTGVGAIDVKILVCLLYTSPSPRDRTRSSMPSSA